MNIEEIKGSLQMYIKVFEDVGSCNDAAREYMDHVAYLLSIIEQAEKALNDIADSKYLTIVYARKRADSALQAIRKGD